MEYLIGLALALLGGLFYYKTKAKSAEALNENSETRSEINKVGGEIEANKGRLEAESQRRSDIQSDIQKNSGGEVDNEELIRFINAVSKRDPKR